MAYLDDDERDEIHRLLERTDAGPDEVARRFDVSPETARRVHGLHRVIEGLARAVKGTVRAEPGE